MSDALRRRDLTKALRFACAGTHGVGAGMAGNELIAYVLENGLPSRLERERIQLERDRREQDTTISSSPELLAAGDVADAPS